MPLKQPKPKTPQQLEELVELIEWKLDSYSPCLCWVCRVEKALYVSQRDALLWALGKNPKNFGLMLRRLQRDHSTNTKHQYARSE
jgi:hypothetical protein